jgi:thermostable 8-oxoguanine DNA glycosylase
VTARLVFRFGRRHHRIWYHVDQCTARVYMSVGRKLSSIANRVGIQID